MIFYLWRRVSFFCVWLPQSQSPPRHKINDRFCWSVFCSVSGNSYLSDMHVHATRFDRTNQRWFDIKVELIWAADCGLDLIDIWIDLPETSHLFAMNNLERGDALLIYEPCFNIQFTLSDFIKSLNIINTKYIT